MCSRAGSGLRLGASRSLGTFVVARGNAPEILESAVAALDMPLTVLQLTSSTNHRGSEFKR
jgi:hypothetical protein